MSRLTRVRRHALPVAVVATTMVIIIVAILQYRWNAAISNATGVRLADTLQMSLVNWQIDLARNLREIEQALRASPADWQDAAAWRQYLDEWRRDARYPALVQGLVLTGPDTAPLRLNETSGRFEQADADAAFATRWAIPSAGASGWRLAPDMPALVRPLTPGSGDARQVVVLLNADVIRSRVLPDLAHRYFQGTDGLDYEVAVIAGQPSPVVLYESDQGFGTSNIDDADGTLDVFGVSRAATPTRSPVQVFHKTPSLVSIEDVPLVAGTEAHAWRLVVRHKRGGPLGAFLATTTRRDLYISSAALALLVLSIGMLVITSSRAQRLAALQMDFVATVSHELRTPLTVINSAADNITQGVVDETDQMRRYGAVIGQQARQLSALVEQILLFARHGRQPQPFALVPLPVVAVVDAALAGTSHLLDASRVTVEQSVPAGLPDVRGDLVAISQCLQNFIVNALKYARDGRWIGISAALAPDGTEVWLSVADRGPGIAAQDLPHIFEPFYRGAQASGSQIHGTGLGLAVARELASAMGGRVSVETAATGGCTFTLHLPIAASGTVRPTVHSSPATTA